jgi:phage FluMu protein Com
MVKCERCRTGFGPIQAAVLEFCPRCKARDDVYVPLIVARVTEESPQQEKAS